MRWWAIDECKDDGVLHHPSDTQQWKEFDTKYQEFHEDLRNIRFSLSTDGMKPFGYRTFTHNSWPVILLMYNLPTWLCQNRKYLLPTIIISGPKAPSIDIDVFLELLIQEIMTLWKHGVEMWDELVQSTITCKPSFFSPSLTTMDSFPFQDK